jgi:multidrug transporter EmrE-like cation transporter
MKLFLALLPTILLTAYSQLVIKWRITALVTTTGESSGLTARALRYLKDPYIFSAFVFSFLAAIAWFHVAERYPVSIAFPTYVGVLFAIVTIASALLLKEDISAQHLVGLALILIGVVVVSRAA